MPFRSTNPVNVFGYKSKREEESKLVLASAMSGLLAAKASCNASVHDKFGSFGAPAFQSVQHMTVFRSAFFGMV